MRLADEGGFDDLWVCDHFLPVVPREDYQAPIYEAWSLLAAMAEKRLTLPVVAEHADCNAVGLNPHGAARRGDPGARPQDEGARPALRRGGGTSTSRCDGSRISSNLASPTCCC